MWGDIFRCTCCSQGTQIVLQWHNSVKDSRGLAIHSSHCQFVYLQFLFSCCKPMEHRQRAPSKSVIPVLLQIPINNCPIRQHIVDLAPQHNRGHLQSNEPAWNLHLSNAFADVCINHNCFTEGFSLFRGYQSRQFQFLQVSSHYNLSSPHRFSSCSGSNESFAQRLSSVHRDALLKVEHAIEPEQLQGIGSSRALTQPLCRLEVPFWCHHQERPVSHLPDPTIKIYIRCFKLNNQCHRPPNDLLTWQACVLYMRTRDLSILSLGNHNLYETSVFHRPHCQIDSLIRQTCHQPVRTSLNKCGLCLPSKFFKAQDCNETKLLTSSGKLSSSPEVLTLLRFLWPLWDMARLLSLVWSPRLHFLERYW